MVQSGCRQNGEGFLLKKKLQMLFSFLTCEELTPSEDVAQKIKSDLLNQTLDHQSLIEI